MVRVEGRPEAVDIDLRRTAFVIVDMQNAFASAGGMLELVGVDVSHVKEIVPRVNRLAAALRDRGARVIWVVTTNESDGSDAGGPDTGIWCRDTALCMLRDSPQSSDRLTFRGTWGAELVEGLAIAPEDTVFEKTRHSAFFRTDFHALLEGMGVRYLLFGGVATNICVEATIRDGYYLGYHPILIADASAAAGPPFMQQATEFNVVAVCGWVVESEALEQALDSAGKEDARR